MKAVILAGGLGSRLSEETVAKPKPMVEIGGKPILWHILNIYAAGGIRDFVIALGYRAEVVKEYFLNFYALNNSITVDLTTGERFVHRGNAPSWKLDLVDTGLETQTGGRIKRVGEWLGPEQTFMATYGDGRRGYRRRGPVEIPSVAREAGDGDHRPPAGPIRPDSPRG
jgi:glucose-1-phosphate cytidylyltransferase